jgi:hypothetical protein
MALLVGNDIDERRMQRCTYKVGWGGTVLSTTRDGWTITSFGEGMGAAFKTRRRRADGSMFRSDGTARFTGVQAFDLTNGGRLTIASFVLSE